MKLTAKKAVELSIELWEWVAETGGEKGEWPEWKINGGKYPFVTMWCFLCKYTFYPKSFWDSECNAKCPYYGKYGICYKDGGIYRKWEDAQTKPTKKKYAQQFLEQLKEILKDMEVK